MFQKGGRFPFIMLFQKITYFKFVNSVKKWLPTLSLGMAGVQATPETGTPSPASSQASDDERRMRTVCSNSKLSYQAN